MKRRQLLKATLSLGVTAAFTGRAAATQVPLEKTPRDYEGPYYPVGSRNRTNDLVTGTATHQLLNVRGRVLNADGNPIAHGLVDLWQADPNGRYKHPRDNTPGERLEEFLYWGEAITNADGEFAFRTYMPGPYTRRPPHIHYKIWHERKRLLTSQVYFQQTGGARGASRNSAKADLQTVSLAPDGSDVQCFLQIVV